MTFAWVLWVSFEPFISAKMGHIKQLSTTWVMQLGHVWGSVACALLVAETLRAGSILSPNRTLGFSSGVTGSMDSDSWGTASLWQWHTESFVYAFIVLLLGARLAKRWGLLNLGSSVVTKPAINHRLLALGLVLLAYSH